MNFETTSILNTKIQSDVIQDEYNTGLIYDADWITYDMNKFISKNIEITYSKKDLNGALLILGSKKEIGEYEFYKSNLSSVIIGNSIKTIGPCAFSRCHKLKTVIIGNSVETIDKYAFYGCSNLNSIIIPKSVKTIGVWAFDECERLNSIIIADDNPNYYSDGNILFNKDKTELILSYNKLSLTEYAIPDSVTSINDEAFRNCRNLSLIIIGNSVKKIGERVFTNCYKLNSIIIPNSVETIGERAFSCCINLTSIIIPNSVKTIGESIFYNCNNLTSVIIGNSVETIGEYAFEDCNKLNSIIIADDNPNYYSDGNILFNKDKSKLILLYNKFLTEYTIPDSVKIIDVGAFQSCDNLTSITIPNSVKKIGKYAFNACKNLTSITIGDSIESINESAFINSRNLTSIMIIYPPNKQLDETTKLNYQQKFINAGLRHKVTFMWKQYTE